MIDFVVLSTYQPKRAPPGGELDQMVGEDARQTWWAQMNNECRLYSVWLKTRSGWFTTPTFGKTLTTFRW